MKAAVLHGSRDLRIEEVPTPMGPRPYEVILKVEYVAICGTDIHLYTGHIPAKTPVILGHEYVGRVFMVGPGVRGFKPGDRVMGSYVISCGSCRFCTIGKPQLCERRILFGINFDGAFAYFMRVPFAERVLVKIPDDLDFRDAVLIPDMFLTAFYAVERSVRPGDYVLVTGLGAVGLSTVIAAKYAGASLVIGVDVRDKPLQIAKEVGADYVIDARKENVVDSVRRSTDGLGVHVALEASGAPPAVKAALESVRPGGKHVQIGIVGKPIDLDLKYISSLEKEIIGILNPGTPIHIRRAMNFIKPRIEVLRKLVTHEFRFNELVKAIEIAEKKIGDPVKIVIKVH